MYTTITREILPLGKNSGFVVGGGGGGSHFLHSAYSEKLPVT